jgi:hypothetical protein
VSPRRAAGSKEFRAQAGGCADLSVGRPRNMCWLRMQIMIPLVGAALLPRGRFRTGITAGAYRPAKRGVLQAAAAMVAAADDQPRADVLHPHPAANALLMKLLMTKLMRSSPQERRCRYILGPLTMRDAPMVPVLHQPTFSDYSHALVASQLCRRRPPDLSEPTVAARAREDE